MLRSSDFGIAPDLVPTLPSMAPRVRVITAEGVGKTGDLYLLATDAVAQFLLRCHESGISVDWRKLWDLEGPPWQQKVQEWRAARQLVNDDSTLVLIEVTG